MRILLGGVAMPTVDGTSVNYKNTTADPVPAANVTIVDNTSSITVNALDELLIIDENVIPNPAQNFLLGPALNSSDTSFYFSSVSGGFGGTVSFAGAPPVTATVTNDNHIGYALRVQNLQLGLIVPGQQYMLSGYIAISTPMNNAQSILKFGWLDAGFNYLGDAAADYRSTTAGGGFVRVSMSAVAPANAVSAQIAFGIQTTAQPTNSGTAVFTYLQFEPMWWPNSMSYPSPDCNPAQSNCRLIPNETTIRQYRKFGGLVVDAKPGNYIGNKRTIDVLANGYAMIFKGVFTISQYSNTYDSVAITGYLDTYFPPRADGQRLFPVAGVVQGALISNVQPNWDDLHTLFNSFAAQAGFFWTADNYWNFLYQPPGYTQMPISIIADNSGNPDMVTTFPIYNFKSEMDATQLGASALVIGGNCSTTLTTKLTNGNAVTSISVATLPAPILDGTVMSVAGRQGITLNGNASAGATSITIFNFTPTADYGVGTTVSTNPYVASVFDPVNFNRYNQAIYGYGASNAVFLRKVNDGSLQSVADVTARGVAELIQYSNPRNLYHGATNVELLAGQSIQVTSSTESLNAQSLLIQQVAAQWLGKSETLSDTWEYQVDLGSVNRTASSILSHIFRQTTKNSSPPGVSNTALAIFERFSYTDVAQSPYALTVLADSPIAYYRLGEPSGSVANDSSGDGFNGTYNGSGVTYGVAGAILNDPNTAVTFDGSAGYINLPSGATPTGFSAITLEAWINLSTTSFGTAARLLSCDNTASAHNGVDFYVQINAAGLTVVIGNGTNATTLAVTFAFQAGVWYHVAATWSNAGNILLYVNGVQIGSGTRSGTIGTPAQTMNIGRNPVTASGFFPGTIDEAAEYQAQLSATRVLKHYNVGITGKA